MKTCKLNKMIGVTAILLITIVAMFTLLFNNVEKSYADEDPATEQQEVAAQNDNLDFWSWLCGTNETDENEVSPNQDEQVAYSDDKQSWKIENSDEVSTDNQDVVNGIHYIFNDANSTAVVDKTECYEAVGDVCLPAYVKHNNKDYRLVGLEDSAFYYCPDLTSIKIPEGVTSIGSHAFFKCTRLKSVTIPEGVTSIRERTFEECTKLSSISIPNSVTEIEWSAFSECVGLVSVTLGNNITTIGKYAFCNCRRLNIDKLPNSVTSIGYKAFGWCDSIKTFEISDNVKSIEPFAFVGCKSLEKVTIGKGITNIEERTFQYCTPLKSITIPENVKYIGDDAFYDTNLNEIKFCREKPVISNKAFEDLIFDLHYNKFTKGWNNLDDKLGGAKHINYIDDGTFTFSGYCWYYSDKGEHQKLSGVEIEVLDMDNNVIAKTLSDENGWYSVEIKAGTTFKMSAGYGEVIRYSYDYFMDKDMKDMDIWL